MFLTRNRRAPTRPLTSQVMLNPPLADGADALLASDPKAQAELVGHALDHLERVRQLVRILDEVPGGDRQVLLTELATTADSLRQLYFVDAIY